MRLSLAVLGLLGVSLGAAGCASPGDAASTDGYANGGPTAQPEAYGPDGAPRGPVDPPAPTEVASPAPTEDAPRAPLARRDPPTPPPHVDELFRTPGGAVGNGNAPQSAAPSPPPATPAVTPSQTSKPSPPPSPPPRPKPWGPDNCPPCGMG